MNTGIEGPWIIRNHSRNMWVATPGKKSSYTRLREHARGFATEADAERDCCGDESVAERCP